VIGAIAPGQEKLAGYLCSLGIAMRGMRVQRRIRASSLLLLLVLLDGVGHAESDCREGRDTDERLEFIQHELGEGARKAQIWSWSWTAVYGSIAAYQLVSATVIDPSRDGRIDGFVGAGSAAIGVASMQLMPLKVIGDHRRLDLSLRAAGPGADHCALLAEAERLLERDAASEAFGRSPLMQAGTLAFNVGLAALLGAGFHHFRTAGITLATGMAVGELEMFTQPTHSIDALRRYRAGMIKGKDTERAFSWTIVPSVGAGEYGLQLVGRF
jgi:hypothetical protein